MSTPTSISSSIRAQVNKMEATFNRASGSVSKSSSSHENMDELMLFQQAITDAFTWTNEDMSNALESFMMTQLQLNEKGVRIMKANDWTTLDSVIELAQEELQELIPTFPREELTNSVFLQTLSQSLTLGTFLLEFKPQEDDHESELDLYSYQKYLASLSDEEKFLNSLDLRGIRRTGRRIKRGLSMTVRQHLGSSITSSPSKTVESSAPIPSVERKVRVKGQSHLKTSGSSSSVSSIESQTPQAKRRSVIKTKREGQTRVSSLRLKKAPESPTSSPESEASPRARSPSPVRLEPRGRPSYREYKNTQYASQTDTQQKQSSILRNQEAPLRQSSPKRPKSKRGISPSAFAFLPSSKSVERAFEQRSASSGTSTIKDNPRFRQESPDLPPSTPFSGDQILSTPTAPYIPSTRRWESTPPVRRAQGELNFTQGGAKLETLSPSNARRYAGELPELSSRQKDALAFHKPYSGLRGGTSTIRRSVLAREITWDGNLDTFSDLKDALIGHYMQVGAGYLFDSEFHEAYKTLGKDCYIHFPDDVTSLQQLKKDIQSLYGALKSSCRRGVGAVILMNHETSRDGLAAWIEMLAKFDADGDKDTRIMRLEDKLSTPYTKRYKGGLTQWLTDYETAMAELTILGSGTYISDQAKRRKIVSMLIKDPGFYWLPMTTKQMSYTELITNLRQLAIQQEKNAGNQASAMARQVLTSKPTPDNTTAVSQALASIVPEVWDQLPPDIKQLVREARRKYHNSRVNNPKGKSPNGNPGGQNPPQPSLPSPTPQDAKAALGKQYSKPTVQANLAETEIPNPTNEELAMILEFINQESEEFPDSGGGIQEVGEEQEPEIQEAKACMIRSNCIIVKDTTKLCLQVQIHESLHVSIIDSGADTSVIGQGWEVISEDPIRKARVVGFDQVAAVKQDLPIVSAITAVDLESTTILLRIHEAVFNSSAQHTLLSEFQLSEQCHSVQAKARRHKGEQTLWLTETLQIPLRLKGCMMLFRNRKPTDNELNSLSPIDITPDSPWDPSIFTDDPGTPFQRAVGREALGELSVFDAMNAPVQAHQGNIKYIQLDPPGKTEMDLEEKHCQASRSQGRQPLEPVEKLLEQDLGNPVIAKLHRALPKGVDLDELSPYLLYRPRDIIKRTIENTTQLATAIIHSPMRRHVKSRFHMLRHKRLKEMVATDTYFANTKSIEGFFCSQVFFGCESRLLCVVGMKTESEFPEAYQDFLRTHGIPSILKRDNANAETSAKVKDINRRYCVADAFTEAYNPQQNAAELNGVRFLKSHSRVLMDRSGAPDNLWFACHAYISEVYNCCANEKIQWQTPYQRSRGDTPDISHLLQFKWFEPLLYLDPGARFPESQEQPGFFIGFGENVGDALTFKVLKTDLKTVIYRSVVRPAAEIKKRNRRVNFTPEVDREMDLRDPEAAINNQDLPAGLRRAARKTPGVREEPTRQTRSQSRDLDPVGTRTRARGVLSAQAYSEQTTKYVPNFSIDYFKEGRSNLNINPDNEDVIRASVMSKTPRDWQQWKYIKSIDDSEDSKEDPEWQISAVLDHKSTKEGCMVLCKWRDQNHSKSWVDLAAAALQDPTKVLSYGYRARVLDTEPFNYLKAFVGEQTSKLRRVLAAKSGPKKQVVFKFGVQVPQSVQHALALDSYAGDNGWKESMDKEIKTLLEMGTFKILKRGEKPPPDYQYVPHHFVHDVKFDLRKRSRLVAGGNWTEASKDDVKSGVVSMDSVRIGFFIGELLNLLVSAGDVGSAFLYGKTREKIYMIAGPEFGPEIMGCILILVMGLYGLKTSAARFHEHLAGILWDLGFRPSRGDPDFWYKDCGTHYEYCACYVDDLLVWSKDPIAILKQLKETYTIKGEGVPEYFLGGDIETMDEHWTKEGINTALSAKTYISQAIPKFEKLFGTEFKAIKTPMDENYHPEIDDTPLLDKEGAGRYRSIIGCLNWIITLGRFDINYATSSLSRFNMAPREGHMKAAQRVLRYLKTFIKGRILVDTDYFDHSNLTSQDHETWHEMYPEAVDELPPKMPTPRGKPVRITVYVDADHAHDLVTRRSVTGILLFLNKTPVRWVCKRQATVETSTYGSELVASRIAVELVLEVIYHLRMIGTNVILPAIMFGDNMSVVLNTSTPSSALKKKHNAIAYHKVREAIAGGIIRYYHVASTKNTADVLTKALNHQVSWGLVKPWLFRQPGHIGTGNSDEVQGDNTTHS